MYRPRAKTATRRSRAFIVLATISKRIARNWNTFRRAKRQSSVSGAARLGTRKPTAPRQPRRRNVYERHGLLTMQWATTVPSAKKRRDPTSAGTATYPFARNVEAGMIAESLGIVARMLNIEARRDFSNKFRLIKT